MPKLFVQGGVFASGCSDRGWAWAHEITSQPTAEIGNNMVWYDFIWCGGMLRKSRQNGHAKIARRLFNSAKALHVIASRR
jgi:hypothetical protein